MASLYFQKWAFFDRVDHRYWIVKVFGGDKPEPLYCSCHPGAGNRERVKVVQHLRRHASEDQLRAYAKYWAKAHNERSIRLDIVGLPIAAHSKIESSRNLNYDFNEL